MQEWAFTGKQKLEADKEDWAYRDGDLGDRHLSLEIGQEDKAVLPPVERLHNVLLAITTKVTINKLHKIPRQLLQEWQIQEDA